MLLYSEKKAKYVFQLVCELGQAITAAEVFCLFFFLPCWLTLYFCSPQLTGSLVEQNTEHKTFPHIPLLWLPWGLQNAIKLSRFNRLSESSEMSLHLFLSQGKWQGTQIIAESLPWQPHTTINELLQPRGCQHTLRAHGWDGHTQSWEHYLVLHLSFQRNGSS